MKKSGFTLIELIAVLVMIGLLIAVVVPNVSNLMKDQNEKKYVMYYKLVNNAVEQYFDTRRDDLGGNENEGCVNDFTIKDLVAEDYLKYFDVESGKTCSEDLMYNGGNGVRNCIICGSPADFNITFLRNAGYKDAGFESKIRIENKEGVSHKEVPIVCIKNNKVVFEKKFPAKACSGYVAENVATVSLYNEISSKGYGVYYAPVKEHFVRHDVTTNYLWYSGQMWRIISYNAEKGTVKIVTDEPVTSITYDTSLTNSKQFKDSNVGIWLNSTFYSSLRTPTRFIEDYDWNYTPVTNSSFPATTNVDRLKVGLLNLAEFERIKGYLGNSQSWWLLSKNGTDSAWVVNEANVYRTEKVRTFYGIRPSVVLKGNVSFNKGGTGAINNPYVIKGEGRIVSSVLLKDRFAGEYVSLKRGTATHLFRIVKTGDDYVRLILETPLNIAPTAFHYDDKVYSSTNYIGEYLNTWKAGLNLVEGDFCRMTITEATSTTSVCPKADLINIDIAIPKIGDMYTNASNLEYWTLNNYDSTKINVIRPNGTIGSKGILEESGIRPVINVSSNVRVSGAGTKASPFVLSQ